MTPKYILTLLEKRIIIDDDMKKARKDAIKQTGIMNTGIGRMITSMKAFGVALRAQIVALGAFRLALNGTGIGALVIGVVS